MPKLSSGQRVAVLVAAKVAAAVALVVVHGRIHQPGPPIAAEAAPAPAVVTAPSESGADGHTLAGARSAALRYLALAERVTTMTEEDAVAAQREAASTAAGPGLVAELRQKLAALRQAYPAGGVRYRVGPLATRAAGAGPDQARVEIWYVGVVSPPGLTPYEEWRLARYDLVWEHGGWRVAAESSGPGPRPAAPAGPEPVSAAALESALAGFDSLTAAP